MAKIKVKTTLEDRQKILLETSPFGILQKNRLLFQEGEIKVTISLSSNTIEMTRESNEYCLVFRFENGRKTTGEMRLKEADARLPMELETVTIEQREGFLFLRYRLKTDREWEEYRYRIEYEVLV